MLMISASSLVRSMGLQIHRRSNGVSSAFLLEAPFFSMVATDSACYVSMGILLNRVVMSLQV